MGKTSSKLTNNTSMMFSENSSKVRVSSISSHNPMLQTLNYKKRVDQMLKKTDLKNPALQAVFDHNIPTLLEELDMIKLHETKKNYEQWLTLVFWFAVHLEDFNMATSLAKDELILRQLVTCALISFKENQQEGPEMGSEEDHNNSEKAENDFESEEFSEDEGENTAKNGSSTSYQKSRGGGSSFQNEGGESEEDEDDSSVDARSQNTEERRQRQKREKKQRKKQEKQKISREEKNKNQQRNLQTEGQNQNMEQYNGMSLGQILGELKAKKTLNEESDRILMLQQDRENYIKSFQAEGITKQMLKEIYLEDIGSLIQLKCALRTIFQNLMTNILKLALQNNEEKLACIIVAYYEFDLMEEMVVRAIASDHFRFLMFIWAFDKNYIKNDRKKHTITFEQIFELVDKSFASNRLIVNKKIRKVLDWKIKSTDNILIALLSHHFDDLATDYMGVYSHFLNKELFIYCISNGNNFFLKKSLVMHAFDKWIFRDDMVINEVLTILREGYRTNFLLNILILIDISVWKNKHLKELLHIIIDYVEASYDKNRLLLSPNPIMSITLAAEMLMNISESKKKFENECFQIKGKLLELGKMYSSKIEDEKYYEKLMMGIDFKGRTVLKAITENKFEPLMDENDPKAENLMVQIWNGKEATLCDGNIFGYSNISHILLNKAKRAQSNYSNYMNAITNFFEPNFQFDYSFQYRFRIKAINFYFIKEFLCALSMLIIFQYINYKYLTLFSSSHLNPKSKTSTDDTSLELVFSNYPEDFYTSIFNNSNFQIRNETFDHYQVKTTTETTTEEITQIQRIIISIQEYINWNFLALFFAVALLFQLALKIVFNAFSKQRVMLDKWTVMDTLCAIFNIGAVEIISNMNPNSLLNAFYKQLLDYLMIVVLCVSWIRFFSYFLVIRQISKLLLTLIAMIEATLAFMFIVCCFILIMASVFTTLYQDTNPEKFGGLAKTIPTLFDAVVAQYNYDDMVGREISFAILQMITVFFSNVLLINYLVAILTTTYENMKQSGVFKYKINLYQYCERYMVAFEDRCYGELVLHSPPLSYLAVFMLFFTVHQPTMAVISRGFSYTMYWIENMLFIGFFFIVELVICPFAFMKIWWNILFHSNNLSNMIINSLAFAITGVPLTLFLVIRDCNYLIRLLSYHQGCKYGKRDELEDKLTDRTMKIILYNEVRATIISLYLRLKQHIKKSDVAKQSGSKISLNKTNALNPNNIPFFENEIDFFHVEDDDYINDNFLYVVKKSIIVEEWKRRKCAMNRKKREASGKNGQDFSSLSNMFGKNVKRPQSSMGGTDSKQRMNSSMHSSKSPQRNKIPVDQQTFKPKDLSSRMKIVFLDQLQKGVVEETLHSQRPFDIRDIEITEDEVLVVENFLKKFTIVSESSINEHLDIMLMLKALPNKANDYSIDLIDQFNFKTFQESLIAFQNLDIVNAFEYFDDKNRERVLNLKEKILVSKTNLSDVQERLEQTKKSLFKDMDFKQYYIDKLVKEEKQKQRAANGTTGQQSPPSQQNKESVSNVNENNKQHYVNNNNNDTNQQTTSFFVAVEKL